MNSARLNRRSTLALGGVAWLGGGSVAEAQGQPPPSTSSGPRPEGATSEPRRLPADSTTHHSLDLPDRKLQFSATAGAIRIPDDKGAPLADIAFIAYQLDGTERRSRKVTFVFNGGPGFASGWLHVGAVGPWRIPIGGDATVPSASPDPVSNAETWLDFTDLVFIDPAGTGYSRVLGSNEAARRRLWSVDGDVAYLAETIRRWLDRFDRSISPKYILGESYGGFRAPRLARELANSQGTGVSGLVLVSPALDLGGRSFAFDPFAYVTRLPSMTAAARAAHGPVTRDQLADAEHYAATDYLLDLTRGERDQDAIARRATRVAEFTGLDPGLVQRYHGLIDNAVFLHELDRAQGRVGSVYDATITSNDPFPLATLSDTPDPVLDVLKAPVSSAMVAIYETRLNWRPDATYRLYSPAANRQWDWGRGFGSRPQAVGFMRVALALDPHFSVLIAHGMFDLITPYFATQLLLDQIPASGGADRVHLAVYPGGHMFYSQDASRVAFRDAAQALFEAH
jgi:carboxypeptidase C (cathepsin A)